MPNIAVLTFPGNNCEVETLRAVKKAGLSGEIFLWNREPSELENFDGVVVPGGFSFEDRGRSGVVAAQEPVLKTLKKMAQNGTPVLGICNGAQIVVESGLILESKENIPAVSLSRNKRKNEAGEVIGTGFYHSWRTLKNVNKKTPFSNFAENFRIPLAHGEGRFVFPKELETEVIKKNLVVFQYVDENGETDNHYPTNPNGSFLNAAAVCNPAGNVVAMMPHPERADEGGKIFESFAKYFSENFQLNGAENPEFSFGSRDIQSEKPADIEFFVQLKITDKAEKTFENVVQKNVSPDAKITRQEKWGMNFSENLSDAEKISRAKEIITSNELLNINKESVLVKISGIFFHFFGGELDEVIPVFSPENSFEVQENEDFVGESKCAHFSHLFPQFGFKNISHGVFWTVENIDLQTCINSPLFASFVGETVFQ